MIIRQNDRCNVRNMRWFLFGMSPDIPAFKTSTKLWFYISIPWVTEHACNNAGSTMHEILGKIKYDYSFKPSNDYETGGKPCIPFVVFSLQEN